MAIHQQYQESLQATVDWLNHMKEKLSLCSDSTGDRTTIQNKLDRLQVSGKLGTELQWVLRYSGDPPHPLSVPILHCNGDHPLALSAPVLHYNGDPPHPLSAPVLHYNGDPPHSLSAPVLCYNGDPLTPSLFQSCTTMGTPLTPSLCPGLALQWGPP